MALTDIVFDSNNSASAARGNVGTLTDILGSVMMSAVFVTLPAIADVKLGVKYGAQGTALTGTYAGGGGSPVYPAVGNVNVGITYGPTGSDYTGTLVQPDPSNVLAGVSYGAGGTEFTGTATGGGGGNTWLRAR